MKKCFPENHGFDPTNYVVLPDYTLFKIIQDKEIGVIAKNHIFINLNFIYDLPSFFDSQRIRIFCMDKILQAFAIVFDTFISSSNHKMKILFFRQEATSR